MKAVGIIEPGKVRVIEVLRPEVGPGDVAIDVAYVGFCGSDLTSYRGLNPLVSYPRVPGHEIAGTVAALGAGANGFAVGQSVTVLPYFNCGTCKACRMGRPNACKNNQTMGVQREGAMTGRIVVPASKVIAVDGLPLRDLALIEPCAVGFHAVRRAAIAPGDVSLIMGAGMIGLGVLMGARQAGAATIAFDLSDAKLDTARRIGADHVINPSKPGWREELARIAPEGPDVVFEAVGAEATFQQAVELVSSCGRVVYIGYAKNPIAYDTKVFITKEIDIRGSRNALLSDFENVISYLKAHPDTGPLVVSRTVSVAQAGEALTAWDAKPGDFTKIMLDLNA